MKTFNGFKNKATYDFALEVQNTQILYKLYQSDKSIDNLRNVFILIMESPSISNINFEEVKQSLDME